MKESLNKIVDAIIQQIQEHPESAPSPNILERWLLQAGFSKGDIAKAMKRVAPEMAQVKTKPRRLGAIRHLSGFESQKLTLEARNALARLELYEMLEPWEREMILDHAMHHDGEVGMDELEYILHNTLYPFRDVETQQTIEAIFEGITDTLN